MEENKNFLPYIITIYGTLKTESSDFEKMKEELMQTNHQFLLSNANEVFIEANEDEYKRINEESKDNERNNITGKIGKIRLIEAVVPPNKVIEQDTESLNIMLSNLRQDIKNAENKLKITFGGYNLSNQEIYEIEDIRNYVSKLFKENPDLFYFLTEESANSKKILACIAKIKSVKNLENKKTIREFELPEETIAKIMESIIISTGCNKKRAKQKVEKLFAEGWED